MKEKNLKIIITLFGVICLYAFLAVRIFPLMNFSLSEKMDVETRDFTKYGELYYFNGISDFKRELPTPVRKYRLSEKNPALNKADILTFGDSFFDVSFQKTFPERLSDTLNLKVYSYMTQDPTRANPFCVLNSNNFMNNGPSKYIIFETVERNVHVKFDKPYEINCVTQEIKPKPADKVIKVIFKNNSEKLFATLLKRGYIFNRLYEFFVTIRFKLFGYISPLTAKYNISNEPWIFYSLEYDDIPGGFAYQYSDEEIERYADNILALSKNMKETYNLDLIFMPIPNKYTIYHEMVDTHAYNNFLPRLYNELNKRHVQYVNLYTEFKSSKDTLYYGTDTHWNKKGVDKALELMLKKMDFRNIFASLGKTSHEE
jgi:hypothetical protein